jgi:hypothetical protein
MITYAAGDAVSRVVMGFVPYRERGLKLKGTNFEYLNFGAYAVIFVDRKLGRVRKVYAKQHGYDHELEVFNCEVAAYEIASQSAELNDLIPAFYGHVRDIEIVDRAGKNVSDEFYTNLAFEAEFADYPFSKIGNCGATQAERDRVCDLFRDHGILHMSDVSVCVEDGKIEKVIDFATREIELWAQD